MTLKGFNPAAAAGGGAWGSITGTLANQTDLQTALDGKQANSGKLTAVAGVGASGGLIENTGASSATIRAIGATNPTDIPQLSQTDTRFARMFTAMPGAGVGTDGDYGVLDAVGLRAVLIKKTAGAWGIVSESFTFAQMMGIASPSTGMTVFVTTIDYLGGVTYETNSLWRYNGTVWRPLYRCTIYKTTADTASITNSVTTFQPCLTLTPPVGLFSLGSSLFGEIRTKTTLNGTPTHSPQFYANGAQLIPSSANVDQHFRGNPYAWANTANILTANGGAAGMDTTAATLSSITMGAAFNGSTVTLQAGATFSATGSDTTVVYEHIALELVP